MYSTKVSSYDHQNVIDLLHQAMRYRWFDNENLNAPVAEANERASHPQLSPHRRHCLV